MRAAGTEDIDGRGGTFVESSATIDGSPETSVFDVLAVVRRRKGLIFFGLVLGLGLAALYYSRMVPQYESSVKILVMKKDANLPARGVEADQFGHDTGDLLSTHVELIQSPRILRNAILKHQLDKLPTFQAARGTAEHFNAVGFVKANLSVTKGGDGQAKDARVLTATFRGSSPEDCAAVLTAVVDSYQEFLGQTFQETSSEAVQLITQAKEELRKDLEASESGYQEFREKAPLLWEGDKGINPYQENLKELEKSLLEVRLRRADVTARLEVIEEALKGSGDKALADLDKLTLISADDVDRLNLMLSAARADVDSKSPAAEQPIRSAIVDTEFQRLLSLLLEERKLLADYGPDHPEVKKIHSQIEMTKAYVESKDPPEETATVAVQPADLLRAQTDMLRHDLAEFDRREKQLLALTDEARRAAKLLVDSESENEIRRADVTRKRELFHAVVDRLNEISLIKDFGGYVTEVIAPVEVPVRAVSPVLLLVLALGGALGLVIGGGLAYLVDISDRTFRSPDEVRQMLGLPLMGDVPAIRPAKRKAAASRNGKNGKPVSPIAATLVAYHRPRSREAEAFRGLRTALSFGTRPHGHKVIQITSPNPKDGKTTVTANLAVSLAQSGKTVLVVDADLRNPNQHKIFGIESKVGLSNVIVGDVEFSDAIRRVGVENLSVLPCGGIPPNPSELLASSTFEGFLEAVREKYDYVLVDSPPLLAVSDPSVVAPRVDGVLMTIRIVKNGVPAAVQARRMLAGVGAEVIGLVIDGFHKDRNFGRYGYYGGKYGCYYGYSASNGHRDYYRNDVIDDVTAADIAVPAGGLHRTSTPEIPEE